MEIKTIQMPTHAIALAESDGILISNVQDALDLLATVNYETGCDRIVLRKDAIVEDFFDLSTKIAGEVLQKFVNYHAKLAIVGDFSTYTSQSLRDFIRESNKGKHVFFAETQDDALQKLDNA